MTQYILNDEVQAIAVQAAKDVLRNHFPLLVEAELPDGTKTQVPLFKEATLNAFVAFIEHETIQGVARQLAQQAPEPKPTKRQARRRRGKA